MKRAKDAADAAAQDGWASACRLYEHLVRGGELVPLPPSTLRIQPGELYLGDALLGYSRLYGMDVTYQQSNSLYFGSASFIATGMAIDAIGNAAARRNAQRMAAVQWRDHARVRTVLTSRRLMCDFQGRWLTFAHEDVIEFVVDLPRWAFVVRYDSVEPLMLHGPAAPWFSVAAARILYGRQGLQLPAFAPLAGAVSHRLRAVTGEVVPPQDNQQMLPPGGR